MTGVITTVAGNGTPGYGGDGGLASGSVLNAPRKIVIGPGNNLYLSDAGNHMVRMISMMPEGFNTPPARSPPPGRPPSPPPSPPAPVLPPPPGACERRGSMPGRACASPCS